MSTADAFAKAWTVVSPVILVLVYTVGWHMGRTWAAKNTKSEPCNPCRDDNAANCERAKQ